MPALQYERLNQERTVPERKKRVAAYCRVSTDNEDQASSFESQRKFFRRYIEQNPGWQLFAIFADEGISGTNTKRRKEFNRMIACAKNGDFDLIITKEISRFARNTLDSIFYTRDLKRHGVGVIFLNDNINTLDGDAELRLAIMSSIAQEESRKTSERVKWGQKRQMEQGVVFGRSMLGYDVKDGRMTINEEGAKIVRLIFHKFADEGKGTHVIARELKEEGILPMRAKEWQNTVILRILRNEKYCGDLVQKNTYTPIFYLMKRKRTAGRRNLSLSEITTSRLFPARCLKGRTVFWIQDHIHRKAGQNTAAAIFSPEKSNAAGAAQATLPGIRPAKTEAYTEHGAAMKRQSTADSIPIWQDILRAVAVKVSVMKMRFI